MTLSDTPGVHHVSAIGGDPQRNAEFYVAGLGLRPLVRTVNFEDKFTHHLYYGDDAGRPGSVVTFFASPGQQAGRTGRPGIRSFLLAVPDGTLSYWADRLETHGADVDEPQTRFGERVLPVRDPDGTHVELVADGDHGIPVQSGPVPEGRAIRGVRGISLHSRSPYVTASLLDTFGFELADETPDAVRYRVDRRGSTVDILKDDAPFGREGAGSIHHVAFSVDSEAQLHEWHDLLRERDFDVSRVKDRHFFHSLYVRDPGGILFELATERPGLGVSPGDDAPADTLRLPPWLEADREMLASQLPPLSMPDWRR
ncbi:VOC family protein [Halomicroarcula sp. F13]|uniref:VOC family protein n=1 Tax=Haloarcula rubra TaxID=2487747 RepID=A0AAW4PPD8_9EURY|nr:VOC family protein [Halomicroarcula rubra]MBX0322094.1 VOC family protein [Halomicroarcula rubra]